MRKKKNATSACKHFRAGIVKPNVIGHQYEIWGPQRQFKVQLSHFASSSCL
jgi:hypothetical protein